MKRRGFIGGLVALVIGGTVGKVAGRTSETDRAHVVNQRAGVPRASFGRGYYGSLPEIDIDEVNGHVTRIWFDDHLVYTSKQRGLWV